LTDYENALNEAKKESKNVLVYFTGSDWCPPCKMLKTDLFDSAEFKALSEEYVLLYVDMPRNSELLSPEQMAHNKEVMGKYNKKGVFPLLKIVNAKGNALDEYSGYSMNGEIQYHMELLNKYK
jgi:thiol-disulfide isomerase/thioredoxin